MHTMWEIVRAGGWMMGPIILASIIAVAIILERLWTLQDRRVLPADLTRRVWQLVETNQVTDKVIAALRRIRRSARCWPRGWPTAIARARR